MSEKLTVKVLKPIYYKGKVFQKGSILNVEESFYKGAGNEYLEANDVLAEPTPDNEEAEKQDLSSLKKAELVEKALALGYEEEVVNAAKKPELVALIEEAEKQD